MLDLVVDFFDIKHGDKKIVLPTLHYASFAEDILDYGTEGNSFVKPADRFRGGRSYHDQRRLLHTRPNTPRWVGRMDRGAAGSNGEGKEV